MHYIMLVFESEQRKIFNCTVTAFLMATVIRQVRILGKKKPNNSFLW